VAILVWILGFIIVKGAGVVSWEFLTSMPENGMTEGGILPAIVGTLCLVAGSIAGAVPLGGVGRPDHDRQHEQGEGQRAGDDRVAEPERTDEKRHAEQAELCSRPPPISCRNCPTVFSIRSWPCLITCT